VPPAGVETPLRVGLPEAIVRPLRETAAGTIVVGDLNVVAPVVSMFFLISYGLLNYATYIEANANSPSFRPRFRWFHAKLSLAGGVGCLGVMLAIHPIAAVVAVVLLFAVYQYVAGSVGVNRWADSGRSHRFQRIREDLHAISAEPEHPRHWRPILLAFADDAERRERLLRFASWLEGRSGLTTLISFVEGDGPQLDALIRDIFTPLPLHFVHTRTKGGPYSPRLPQENRFLVVLSEHPVIPVVPGSDPLEGFSIPFQNK